MKKEKLKKVARKFLLGAAALLAVSIVSLRIYQAASHHLFCFIPGSVVTISFENRDRQTHINVSGDEKLQKIVDLLNGFRYESRVHNPPAGGGGTWATLGGPILFQPTSFDIFPSGVGFSRGDGTSVTYESADPEYFQPLFDLLKSR